MLIVFLFGLLLCISPMTALRGEEAVGILDIAMVIVAVASFGISFRPSAILDHTATPRSPTRNLYAEPVARFWMWAAPLLIVSTLINISAGNFIIQSLGRDALSLIGAIVTALATSAVLVSRYRPALVYGLCTGAVAICVAYAVSAMAGIGYNDDGRFVGASLNPNQTALQSIALVTICYFTNRTLPSKAYYWRPPLIVAIICGLIFGIATVSDAFRGALLPIVAALAFSAAEKLFGSRIRAAMASTLFLLLVMALVEFRNPDFIGSQLESITKGLQTGNQDLDRLSLWQNGIAAWRENIFFGNGIGAWSGIAGPFEGIEAHNSIIDWLSIAGVFGGITYFFLVKNIFKFNIKSNIDNYLFFSSVIIYSMFGFFFRNPLFWVSISFILFESFNIRKSNLKVLASTS